LLKERERERAEIEQKVEAARAAKQLAAAEAKASFAFRARSVSAALQSMKLASLLKKFQELGLDDDEVRKRDKRDLERDVPDMVNGNTYDQFAQQFKIEDSKVHEIHARDLMTKDLIGKGSFGQVFKIRLAAVGFVAVKESWGSVVKFDRDAVLRELQKLRALSVSDHVVKCLGQVELPDSKMGIVLELLECDVGDDKVHNVWELLTYMRQGRKSLSWAEKVHICLGVAQGLSDIHAIGMLHRDLKLENVLVGGAVASGQPLLIKIADFGESKYVGDLSLEPTSPKAAAADVKGTLRIRAPELLRDAAPVYSEKSDSYALGIFVWEVAKGGRAYGLDDIQDQGAHDARLQEVKSNVLLNKRDDINDFLDKQKDMPPGFQAALKKVIIGCWKPNPDDRFTASQVVAELRKLLAPP